MKLCSSLIRKRLVEYHRGMIDTVNSVLSFAYSEFQTQAAVLLNTFLSSSDWRLICQRYNCRRLNQSLARAPNPLFRLVANPQYSSRRTRRQLVMNIVALLIASESHLGPFAEYLVARSLLYHHILMPL